MSGQERAVGDFRIDEERRDGAIALAVHGEADLRSSRELKDRLGEVIAEAPGAVLVDLSDVTLLDSSALGVLLTAMKTLRGRGAALPLVVPATDVRRVFELTLLDRIFDLHGSREEAYAAVAAGRHPRVEAR